MDALGIFRRLQNVFVRGTYQARASDGKLTAQQLGGEVNSALPNPQQYGFASKGVGGRTYTICNGGSRDAGVVVLHEIDGAPALADNEVAVWNNQGASVILKADGSIELNGSDFGGLVKIDDLTTALNTLVSELQAHTHVSAGAVNSGAFTTFAAADYENTEVEHG